MFVFIVLGLTHPELDFEYWPQMRTTIPIRVSKWVFATCGRESLLTALHQHNRRPVREGRRGYMVVHEGTRSLIIISGTFI